MSPARRRRREIARVLMYCPDLTTERCVPCFESAPPPRGPEFQPGGLWGLFDMPRDLEFVRTRPDSPRLDVSRLFPNPEPDPPEPDQLHAAGGLPVSSNVGRSNL